MVSGFLKTGFERVERVQTEVNCEAGYGAGLGGNQQDRNNAGCGIWGYGNEVLGIGFEVQAYNQGSRPQGGDQWLRFCLRAHGHLDELVGCWLCWL